MNGPLKACSQRQVTGTNVMLTGKMNVQPILSVRVPMTKIKGAACQRHGYDDGVVQC